MNDQTTNIKAYHQVVLLQKGDQFAAIALTRALNGIIMLGRSDRSGLSHSIQTAGFSEAVRRLDGSVISSVDNGWAVVWRGFPYGRPSDACRRCFAVMPPEAKYCGHCGGRIADTLVRHEGRRPE